MTKTDLFSTLESLLKTKSFLLFSILICISNKILATNPNYQRISSPDEKISLYPLLVEKNIITSKPNSEQVLSQHEQRIKLTPQQLQNQPELLTRLLLSSLIKNDSQGVNLLFPLYEKLDKKQPHLLLWSQAILAHKNSNLTESIRLYREVISQQPNWTAARLQLAIALFKDQQNEAAQDQFNRLRAEISDSKILQLIEHYQQVLLQRSQWNLSGGISYLYETNINNVSKQKRVGNWTNNEQQENAQGISYHLEINKRWMLNQGFFLPFSLSGRGKYYWDNHKYDEFSLHSELGLGYQNNRLEVAVKPFIEQFWYAGGNYLNSQTLHRYSTTTGISLDTNYWLTRQWKIETELEYGKTHYAYRQDLKGHHWDWSNSALFVPNSQQYWFAGIGLHHKSAVRKSNSFSLQSFFIGWGQEWSWGISSRLSLSYLHRTYKAPLIQGMTIIPVPDFYKTSQKNNEYMVNLTIWHRALHFYGITPKLTWSYQRVKSNNPFNSYNRNRVYLNFSKTF